MWGNSPEDKARPEGQMLGEASALGAELSFLW